MRIGLITLGTRCRLERMETVKYSAELSYADPEIGRARAALYPEIERARFPTSLTGDIAFFWTLMRKESDNLVILPVTCGRPRRRLQ